MCGTRVLRSSVVLLAAAVVLFGHPVTSFAQSTESLQDRMRDLQQQIDQLNQQLKQMREDQAKTQQQASTAAQQATATQKKVEAADKTMSDFMKGFFGTFDMSVDETTKGMKACWPTGIPAAARTADRLARPTPHRRRRQTGDRARMDGSAGCR